MTDTTIRLTDIFTISTLKLFFRTYKGFFNQFDKEYLRHIKRSIFASINCRNPAFAKTVFVCETCNLKAYRPVTCKSRFCITCGAQYAIDWALKIMDTLIDCPHRCCVFTIPDSLWNLSLTKREILAEISDEIHNIIKYHFDKAGICSFGMIINIHTFGRDSKFNTHFHVTFSEGGFTKKKTFKDLKFIQGQSLNIIWRSKVLNIFKKHYQSSPKKLKLIYSLRNQNFFVNIKGKPLKNDEKSIKYLGRYLARPAISENRITAFDGKNVTFWYTDVDTQKKVSITLPLFQFVCRLIVHIPPKGFKMVRRYGFYARRKTQFTKECITLLSKKKLFKSTKLPWNLRILKTFGKDPLICPNCETQMVIAEFHHKKYGSYYYLR